MEENYRRFSSSRPPLKTLNYNKLNKNTINLNWKHKLRESYCRRVREDRACLLWNPGCQMIELRLKRQATSKLGVLFARKESCLNAGNLFTAVFVAFSLAEVMRY
ncbi:hypothetical protein Ancab_022290 [Ancistrocladus abbreviatus]